MARCNNCGTKLGCSCKKRTASDGKSCCANCIAHYERVLKQTGRTTSNSSPGVILRVSAEQKK